jgi:hypothetical protein
MSALCRARARGLDGDFWGEEAEVIELRILLKRSSDDLLLASIDLSTTFRADGIDDAICSAQNQSIPSAHCPDK